MFTVKDILKLEVAPALGCTEPAAIALGTAVAADVLPSKENIERIEVKVDKNIYKNAFAVSIPGTEGESGLQLAAALGVVGCNPYKKLEVLDTLTKEGVEKAKRIVAQKRVSVELLKDKSHIYMEFTVVADGNEGYALIERYHDNIVKVKLNGKEINHPLVSKIQKEEISLVELEKWLSSLSLQEIIDLLDELDEEDMQFLKNGLELNLKLAEYGLKHGSGLGVGLSYERLIRQGLYQRDMSNEASKWTSAAADARMSGVKMPAMSSAGSGNHGLTAILPIWAVSQFVSVDENVVLKGIALSHIITAYIKSFTGRLSAVCGCSVAAGAGATAGITYLLGGSKKHIAGAIKNLIQDLSGVICDGAKTGCALKLATAAASAVRSSLLSLQGIVVSPTDGIISKSAEDTISNLGKLSHEGMIEADRTILNIMIAKKF